MYVCVKNPTQSFLEHKISYVILPNDVLAYSNPCFWLSFKKQSNIRNTFFLFLIHPLEDPLLVMRGALAASLVAMCAFFVTQKIHCCTLADFRFFKDLAFFKDLRTCAIFKDLRKDCFKDLHTGKDRTKYLRTFFLLKDQHAQSKDLGFLRTVLSAVLIVLKQVVI